MPSYIKIDLSRNWFSSTVWMSEFLIVGSFSSAAINNIFSAAVIAWVNLTSTLLTQLVEWYSKIMSRLKVLHSSNVA